MEKIVEQGLLYDFYGELLTKHQQSVYEDVVFNDLSLSEIADEQGITRQGVHDLIRRCDRPGDRVRQIQDRQRPLRCKYGKDPNHPQSASAGQRDKRRQDRIPKSADASDHRIHHAAQEIRRTDDRHPEQSIGNNVGIF